MKQRLRQKSGTRARIRNTAKELFYQNGFESTTSRNIAKSAGVAVGTVFAHFPNKRAILADILYEDIEVTLESAFGTILPGQTIQQSLSQIARCLYTYYNRHVELSLALIGHSLMEPFNEQNDFRKQLQEFIPKIASMIQESQNKGELPSNKDPLRVAEAYFACYFYVLIGFLQEESPAIDLAVERLEVLLSAILE